MRQQPLVAVGVRRVETADLSQGVFQSAAVVERVAVPEAEAIPRLQRHQRYIVGEFLSVQIEKFLEQERCGDHRRAGVVAIAVAFEHLGAAAEHARPVEYENLVALGAQPQRRRDPAEPRAHHDGLRGCSRG
jgi:hypothetical protein